VDGEDEELLRNRRHERSAQVLRARAQELVRQCLREPVVADPPVQLDVYAAGCGAPDEVDVVSALLAEAGPERLQRLEPGGHERGDIAAELSARNKEVEIHERSQARVGVETVGYGGTLQQEGRIRARGDDPGQLAPQQRRVQGLDGKPPLEPPHDLVRERDPPLVHRREDEADDIVVDGPLREFSRVDGPYPFAAQQRCERRNRLRVREGERPPSQHGVALVGRGLRR